MLTNHPVRFLGPVPFRPTRILSLAHVQAAARAALEVDLSALPPLISGGDRKARAKAVAEQRSSLSAPRRIGRLYRLRPDPTYDTFLVTCPHCRHSAYLDEWNGEPIRCDRCQRDF